MKKRLSDFETELLKKLERLFLDLSALQKQDPAALTEASLFQLKTLLQQLSHSEDPELQKCARLTDHVYPEMSERHFMNLLIPIERALGRNLKDSDFMVTDQDRSAKTISSVPLYFVLENMRSSFNVGSILRLADGLGVSGVYLCGYTPGTESDGVKKTALGADEGIKIERFETTQMATEQLRSLGIEIVGLETAKTAQSLFDSTFTKKTAFLVGNERFGLDAESLKLCDAIVELPLRGMKNSLNVATALSGAAFEWTRQNRQV